jgi:hypothetical protein
MALATYNPNQIAAVVCGIPLQGFADGSMIKIEYNEDQVTLKVGAQGDGVRTINQNRSAKITVMLQASSPSNLALSALALLDRPRDRTAAGGGGVGASRIQDLNGTVLAFCDATWVVKHATVEYAKESGDREWVFETHDMNVIAAGADT